MARAKTKMKVVSSAAAEATKKTPIPKAKKDKASVEKETNQSRSWSDLFGRMASTTAQWTGKPVVFLTAMGCVLVWAATGPLFHYSDTWQLVINTSTTIITFLMVFLIQNTQNRDTMALQLKLSELVLVINDAEDRVANAENLSDHELEELQAELRARADAACDTLNSRKELKSKKAG